MEFSRVISKFRSNIDVLVVAFSTWNMVKILHTGQTELALAALKASIRSTVTASNWKSETNFFAYEMTASHHTPECCWLVSPKLWRLGSEFSVKQLRFLYAGCCHFHPFQPPQNKPVASDSKNRSCDHGYVRGNTYLSSWPRVTVGEVSGGMLFLTIFIQVIKILAV